MKKIFTLAAVALVAMSANAQESWYVNTDEGTLKECYVANEDASAMSVVEFATENVTGTHTSGPISGYTDGDSLPLEAKVDNSWGSLTTKALSSDGSVAPFYYVQGKGNPVNISLIAFEEVVTDGEGTGVYRADWTNSYYLPDGSNGFPTNGTYVTLTPAVDGTMTVAVWVNKGNREFYIVKKSDATALSLLNDVTVSGYVNGTNWSDLEEGDPRTGYPAFQDTVAIKEGTEEEPETYVITANGNQACWVYVTFSVVANETYYIFNKSTQIGFSGFEFTAAESTGIKNIVANDNADAPSSNLAGQRVNATAKGLLIQNGKKYIVK